MEINIHSMKQQILLLLTMIIIPGSVFAQQVPLKFNLIEDLKKGRLLQDLLNEGKTDSIYGMMSDQFQKLIKGKDEFAALNNSLEPQLGKEISLLEEASFREAGMVSYYQISRYEKAPSVTKRWVWKDSTIAGLSISPTISPAATDKEFYKTKTALRLPFEGTWYTAWGGSKEYLNKHVQSGNQRFAFDFLKTENGEVLKNGKRTANSDFYSYGARVLSPGKGTVIKVVDSIQDNVLGEKNETVPPGNHVVIDHGNGEYSFLAHFKKGSIEVVEGDQVEAGEFLGLAGNSGKSDVPHLHYHLQTGKAYNKGEGLPVQFENYVENGINVTETSPVRGYLVRPQD